MASADHNATNFEILGQPVRVSKSGIVWRNPDDGRLQRIGTTRIEAESRLADWYQDRASFFRPPRPRMKKPKPLPPPKAPKPERLARMYTRAYHRAKSRANRYGGAMMTMDEFRAMVKRSGDACEISGIAFSLDRKPEHHKAMWAPSIDRLDCRVGYEFNNCRLVCIAVNLAINEFGAGVMMKIARAVMRREKKKRQAPSAS